MSIVTGLVGNAFGNVQPVPLVSTPSQQAAQTTGTARGGNETEVYAIAGFVALLLIIVGFLIFKKR